MTELLFNLFVYIIESTALFLIANASLNIEWKQLGKRPIPCIVGISAIATTLDSLFDAPVNTLLGIFVTLLIYMYLFKVKLDDAFFAYAIAYILLACSQLLIILLLPKTLFALTSTFVMIGGNLLMVAIAAFIKWKVPLHKLYYNASLNTIFKLSISCLFIIQLINIIYSKLAPEESLRLIPSYALFGLILLIISIHMLRQQESYHRLQAQLEDYETYQPIFAELVEHVRERQHEFDNQLLTIRSLPIIHKDYDSLAYALTNDTATAMGNLQTTTLVRINLKLVAAFLFSKSRQAENMNKHLNIVVKQHIIHTQIPEYELIDVLGILIDNALEAIDTDESVSLSLDSQENQIIITILNKGPSLTSELRTAFFKKGYSTKVAKHAKEKRGLGLPHLKELVDKYNGMIVLDNHQVANDMLIEFQVTI